VSIISAQNVVKRFGDVVAVDDISFEVEKGEIFAFLGPNGAGKSTTIKMMTTMLRPTSGTLKLAGHDVTKEQDAARKAFGIVFQDPSLDEELSAYENMELHGILYGVTGNERRQRIEDLLKLVELWGRKDSMVKTFSGGMRRRLEIARGLLHEPRILFLDEPTLGLDTQTRKQTSTKSLEEAYLKLTGMTLRDESSASNDGLNLRMSMRNRNLR
jgi:ABC-2 type transport system ATP-binding protein